MMEQLPAQLETNSFSYWNKETYLHFRYFYRPSNNTNLDFYRNKWPSSEEINGFLICNSRSLCSLRFCKIERDTVPLLFKFRNCAVFLMLITLSHSTGKKKLPPFHQSKPCLNYLYKRLYRKRSINMFLKAFLVHNVPLCILKYFFSWCAGY